MVRYGVTANITAFHAVARGSIPRTGICFKRQKFFLLKLLLENVCCLYVTFKYNCSLITPKFSTVIFFYVRYL